MSGDNSNGVNVNTPSPDSDTSGEPIVVNGGETIDWDQLEATTMPKPEPKSKAKKEADGGGDDDDEEASGKDADEDQDESPEGDKAKKGDKEKEKGEGKPKVSKVKVNGKDVEIPHDTKFTHTVDGKPVEVTVQELLNDYSGRTHWQKKYTELDNDKKTFHADKQKFETDVKSINETIDKLHVLAVKENKPLEAIAFLTEMMGGDPSELMDKIEESFEQSYQEISKLTPEQKQIRRLERKNDLTKQLLSRAKAQRDEATARTQLETRVKEAQQSYGVTEEDFVSSYNYLKKTGKDPDPEYVAAFAHMERCTNQVSELVKPLGLENSEAVTKELVDEWFKDPSLTIDHIKAIMDSVYGTKALQKKSKLKEKIERSSGEKFTPSNTSKSPNRREPITFDDLD